MKNEVKFKKSKLVLSIIGIILCLLFLFIWKSRAEKLGAIIAMVVWIVRAIKFGKFHAKSKLIYDEKNIQGIVVGIGKKKIEFDLPMSSVNRISRKGNTLTIATDKGIYDFPFVKKAESHEKTIRRLAQSAGGISRS